MAEKKNAGDMSRSAAKRQSLDHVDYAKAIGILLVVLGHVNLVIPKSDHTFYSLVRIIYSFHMPLFFVITGFLLGYKDSISKKDAVPALKAGRLFVRLMVPYFIYSAIYILVSYYRYGNADDHIGAMITATWTTMGNAPLWFLATLFFARLVFHFLRYKLRLDARVIFAGTLYATLFAVKIYSILKKEGLMAERVIRFLTASFVRMIPAVFFITFGYLFFRYVDPKKKRRDLAYGLILGCILVVCCYLYPPSVNMHTLKFGSLMLFMLTGVTGSAAVILLSSALPEGIKPLREIGRDSMEIMVIHYDPMPFIFIANSIIVKAAGGTNFILIWLVTCLMVIPAALVWKYIKELPKLIITKLKSSVKKTA